MKKYLWILFGCLICGGITAALYFATKKFLSDREQLVTSHQRPRQFRVMNDSKSTQRIYTQKEIEEARKKGTLPEGMKQPYIPNNSAADAAVQQSLRTLQEINKINEMNRKLIDQQQRQQQQR